MSQQLETSGTVTSVSEDSGEVDTLVFNRRHVLTFSASDFFTFGFRCNGVLTDYLKIGEQVNVLHTVDLLQLQVLEVPAVWLGGRPEILGDCLYNRECRIVFVGDDFYLAQTNFRNHNVIVSKNVVFYEGYPIQQSAARVNIGQRLMFDAVPIKSHSLGCEYLATCAWFGLNEPRILDRFNHSVYARADEYLDVDNVVGKVSVIPNDSVAMIDVPTFNSGKVILTKEVFHPPCESLKHAVRVGEKVIMRLNFGRFYSDSEMWYVVWASKHFDPEDEEEGLKVIMMRRQNDEGLDNDPAPGENADKSTEDNTILNGQFDLKMEFANEASSVLVAQEVSVLQGNVNTERECDLKTLSKICLQNTLEPQLQNRAEIPVPTGGINSEQLEVPDRLSSCLSEGTSVSQMMGTERFVHKDLIQELNDGTPGINKEPVEELNDGTPGINKEPVEELNDGELESRMERSEELYDGTLEIIWERIETKRETFEELSDETLESRTEQIEELNDGTFEIKGEPIPEAMSSGEPIHPEKQNDSIVAFQSPSKTPRQSPTHVQGEQEERKGLLKRPYTQNEEERFGIMTPSASCSKDIPVRKYRVTSHAQQLLGAASQEKGVETEDRQRSASTSKTSCSIGASIRESRVTYAQLLMADASEEKGVETKDRQRSASTSKTSCSTDAPVRIPEETLYAQALAAAIQEEAVETEEPQIIEHEETYPEKKAPLGRVYRGEPFWRSWPAKNSSFLLDWTGILTMDRGQINFTSMVDPAFGKVSHEIEDVVINAMNGNKPVTCETLRLNGNKVYFDAERVGSSDDRFIVKRMWFKQGNRPSPELLLMSELRYDGSATFDQDEKYRGKILLIPLHDCAIANVNGVRIIVKFDSLVIDREYNHSYSTIDMFLSVGSHVFVKVAERTAVEGERYFEAVRCWNEVTRLPTDPKVQENLSWSEVWGTDKLYKEGVVRVKDGYVGVSFDSSKSVDATNCMFFKDGALVSLSSAMNLVNRKVTCHVAHGAGGDYVVCAWIGRCPSIFDYPKHEILTAPNGLVNLKQVHEGTVEDFPLPNVVQCKIGVVPVVGNLTLTKRNSNKFRAVEKDLRIGQRVLMEQLKYKKRIYIVCTKVIANEYSDDNKALVNFPGRVVKRPNPKGIIEANGGTFKVSFDLSCVRNLHERKTNVFNWAKLVRQKVREGASVRFTAKKELNLEKPLRACEVYVDYL